MYKGFFATWEELGKSSHKQFGGKAVNLGRLYDNAIPIPSGFAISSNWYNIYVNHNRLERDIDVILNLTKEGAMDEERLKIFAQKLQLKILEGTFPEDYIKELFRHTDIHGITNRSVVVRSSASDEDSVQHSFAGIYDSILNVVSPDSILDAIKKCYASLWSWRAITYRVKKKIHLYAPSMALILMEFVEAQSSGVCFTIDPLTNEKDMLVIQTNYGLGESLVGGHVDPDEYRVDIGNLRPSITSKRIGLKEKIFIKNKNKGIESVNLTETKRSKCVLSDSLILNLSEFVTRIWDALSLREEHLDIEFLYDGEKFLFLQARPISTPVLSIYRKLSDQSTIWSNANFRDVMPFVQTPLGWSLMKKPLGQMLTAPIRSVGYRVEPQVQHVKLHNGRAYMNLSALQWEMHDVFGVAPAQFNDGIGGHQPEISVQHKTFTGKVFELGRKMFFGCTIAFILCRLNKFFKEIHQYVNEEVDREVSLDAIDRTHKKASVLNPKVQLINIFSGLVFQLFMVRMNSRYGEEAGRMANQILREAGNISTAEIGYRLRDLALLASTEGLNLHNIDKEFIIKWTAENKSQFWEEFSSFLKDYGHRCINELDLSAPRWNENPLYLIQIISSMMDQNIVSNYSSPNELALPNSIFEKYERIFLKKLTTFALRKRETAKSTMVKLLEKLRFQLRELGCALCARNLLDNPDDVFFVNWYELVHLFEQKWDGQQLKLMINERKRSKVKFEEAEYPDFFTDGHLTSIKFETISPNVRLLNGLGVSSGVATGSAICINDPNEATALTKGQILVVPSTDPAWTPLFLNVSAIAMETGGYLSHGAIVAREYGIPAVANVKNLMKKINGGHTITVDGDKGKIYI